MEHTPDKLIEIRGMIDEFAYCAKRLLTEAQCLEDLAHPGLPTLQQGETFQAPPPFRIAEAAVITLLMFASKNVYYRNSWCKRGEVDAFLNLARKFDRTEYTILLDREHPRADDVIDLATYGLMQSAFHLHNQRKAMLDALEKDGFIPLPRTRDSG